jgi:hypothetical protein
LRKLSLTSQQKLLQCPNSLNGPKEPPQGGSFLSAI